MNKKLGYVLFAVLLGFILVGDFLPAFNVALGG